MATTTSSFTHRLYTGEFAFDFIGNKKRWFTITVIALLIAVASITLRGLNLGIDFVGGSVFQAPVQVTESTVNDYASVVGGTGVSELDAQVSTIGDSAVRVQTRSLNNDEVNTVRSAIAENAGISSEDVAYSLIGPSWGKQITKQAVIALVVFMVLVGLLIWAYFREWKMSVVALLALFHDMIITVGVYSLIGFTVSPATVIAVLTVMGYSLYDTVVVFDILREQTVNLNKQTRTYSQAANAAINQVLVRSINTTLIAVLPVAAILVAGLVVLGGEGPLANLGLAMLVGMTAGAYSSIIIATPLLAVLREREPAMIAHRERLNRTRRKGRAKVSAVAVASSSASPSDVPLSVSPTEGVTEFASEEMDIDVSDEQNLPAPGSGARHQPSKGSRASRKK